MVEQMKSNVSEWKSTTIAILAAVVAVGNFAIAALDGEAATVPDYAATSAAIVAAVGLLFSRFGK